MSNYNSLPAEASPQTTDTVFTARGSGAGAERRATIAAIIALVNRVTQVTAADLAPLFTTNVSNGTTTPAITFSLTAQNQRRFLAGPASGIAAAPTFRLLVNNDIPDLSTIYQVLNPNLTALADNGGNGLWVFTDAGTGETRQILRTANEITLTNGNGVNGNPTVSLPAAITLTGKTLTGGTFTTPTINGAIGGTGTLAGNRLTGLVPIANLATGTPDGSKFVRDDGTLATPSASSIGLFTYEQLTPISGFGDYTIARPAGSRHHTATVEVMGSGYNPNIILPTTNSPSAGDLIIVAIEFNADKTIVFTFYSGSSFGLGLLQFSNEMLVPRRVEFRFVFNGTDWEPIHTQEILIRDLSEAFSGVGEYAVIDSTVGGTRKILTSNL